MEVRMGSNKLWRGGSTIPFHFDSEDSERQVHWGIEILVGRIGEYWVAVMGKRANGIVRT
eukprot:4742208-Alexandrium_andersonii.AAC.1